MICPLCFYRYADFSEKDFEIINNKIVAKNNTAEKRRMDVYYSNEAKSCGCDEEGG
ncbi:MAG: hypothetical protein AAB851_01020 [Patescibacteria group bacterium]